MVTVERSVEVAASPAACWERLLAFADYPLFLAGVETVEVLDEAHLALTGRLGGPRREWTVAITERNPEQMLAWSAVGGAPDALIATLLALPDGGTRIELRRDVEADSEAFREPAEHDLERLARLVDDDGEPHATKPATEPTEPSPVAPADPRGLLALDREGEELGHVAGVTPAPDAGPARYLAIDLGPLAGARLVPAAGATYNAVWDAIAVPHAAARVREAPALGASLGDVGPSEEEMAGADAHFGAAAS